MRKIKLEDYTSSEISEDLLEEIYKRKLFKLFVPKDYVGLMLDLKTASHHLTDIASYFGGLGWILNLGAGANWFSGFFDSETAKSIFSSPKTVVAGSGSVTGTFEVKNKSVVIDGKWSRCSGAAHASFFSLNAKNKNSGKISSFIVPKDLVNISDEKWEIFGLKSTSSFSINLNDIEISEKFGFQINTIKNHLDYKVFHIPFEEFSRICMTSCFIGIAQCYLNAVHTDNIFGSNHEHVTAGLQKNILQAIQNRDSLADIIQEKSDKGILDAGIRDHLKVELGKGNILILNDIQEIFKKGGVALVDENRLSHWAYRDVLTAIQHKLMKP